MLAEAGITLAMAWVLSQIKIFPMPMGGSVTAGSMVPLLVFSFRWGGKKGMLVCALYGVLDFVLGAKYSFHPISLIFDYPVAYGFMGVAGFFGKKYSGMVIGTVAAMLGRFASHVLSGVVVFSSYAPEGQDPLLYSVLYNGSYLLPELVISFALVFLLLRYAKLPEPRLDRTREDIP
jgi:thiamine transporter